MCIYIFHSIEVFKLNMLMLFADNVLIKFSSLAYFFLSPFVRSFFLGFFFSFNNYPNFKILRDVDCPFLNGICILHHNETLETIYLTSNLRPDSSPNS